MADRPADGPDTPASARICSYWAGGRDHYRPDRGLADGIAKICPGAPRMARDSREFTGRAVARAAREGIGQFLDLDCGYPLGIEIHDIARAMNPEAAVAYVDSDEDIANYASWLYVQDRKLKGITATRADLRDPGAGARRAGRPAGNRPGAACVRGHVDGGPFHAPRPGRGGDHRVHGPARAGQRPSGHLRPERRPGPVGAGPGRVGSRHRDEDASTP